MGERGTIGGRGYRYGEDQNLERQESQDLRVATKPKADTWFITNADSQGWRTQDSVQHTSINFVYFTKLNPLMSDMQVAQARIDVTVLSATHTVETAIYRFEKAPKRSLVIVPKTHCTFETDTTGRKTVNIDKHQDGTYPMLRAGEHYFIGARVSDVTTLEVRGIYAGTTEPILQSLRYPYGVKFSHNIPIEEMDTPDANNIVQVVYLSPLASEVYA